MKNIYMFEELDNVEFELQELYSEEIKNKILKSKKVKLFKKIITQADLISAGKNTKVDDRYEKQILNYLSIEEMRDMNYNLSTKQSNISLPQEFFDFIKVKRLERRKGKHQEKHTHENINDKCDVFIENNQYLKYFTNEYTNKISLNLGKNSMKSNAEYEDKYLTENHFINIDLHQAIHGVGTSKDLVFTEIRRNVYRKDIMYFLCLENLDNIEVIIILKKNPVFFKILGLNNNDYTSYLLNLENIKNKNRKENINIEEEKSRKKQKIWRDNLAYEMMNYTQKDGIVFCPISGLEVDYDKMGTIMRASHIKSFAESTKEEVYDINNGILMCANADALFDKHLFTINDNKEFIYQESIINEYIWVSNLHFNAIPNKMILNDQRMKYLKFHNQKYKEKTAEIKGTNGE